MICNTRIIYCHLFIFLFSLNGIAQSEIERGFAFLESGSFHEAERFFEGYLNEHPADRTARICYGRAIGLNGNPQQAITHFQVLSQEYPSDPEVLVNLGESYMWSEQFDAAETIFEDLLGQDSTLFSAHLGLTNALSAQKKYDEARVLSEQLYLSYPEQNNVQITRKFVLLGLSASLRGEREFERANQALFEILHMFPSDREALIAQAEVYLISQAPKLAGMIYRRLVQDSIDLYQGNKGLAYTDLIQGKLNRSLDHCNQAIASVRTGQQSSDNLAVQLLKVDILGAQKKFTEAFELLDSLQLFYTNNIQTSLARARLHFWNYDLTTAKDLYETLMVEFPSNPEVQIGYADILRASNQPQKAMDHLQRALESHPDRSDIFNLLESIRRMSAASGAMHVYKSHDSGGNQQDGGVVTIQTGHRLPINLRVTLGMYNNRNATNDEVVRVRHGAISFNHQIGRGLVFNGGIGLYDVQGIDIAAQQKLTGRVAVGTAGPRKHHWSLGLVRSVEDYTVGITKQDLRRTSLEARYHFTPAARFGFYSQYSHSFLSDMNQRRHLFVSFYRTLFASPNIRMGINGSLLSHQDAKPEMYYSPRSQQSAELFAGLQSTMHSRWTYGIDVAAGFRKQPLGESNEVTFRISVESTYNITPDLKLGLKYNYGNVMLESTTGYRASRMELHLGYIFFRQSTKG